jgi:hypothetical protein
VRIGEAFSETDSCARPSSISLRPVMTPFTETKLFSYMFVLCLFVDNFVTEFTELAKDLSMEPSK